MSDYNNIKQGAAASTLVEIEARLRELSEGAQDVSSLVTVEHAASKLKFKVGPMNRVEHETWHTLKAFEDQQWRDGGGEKNNAPLVRNKSDAFLLQNALWTEEGEKISAGIADVLMNGRGFGPSTYALLEVAATYNPPRSQLVGALAQMWGSNASNLVFWRVLKELGLFKLLLDRLAGDSSEKEFAEREIEKVEQTLMFWEAASEVQDAAREEGFEVYDR